MIISIETAKVLLGLGSSITEEEQAMLDVLHPLAEGAVKQWLKYEPEQKSHTEYLPRDLKSGGPGFAGSGEWDFTGDTVMWFSDAGGETLQLTNIPVRLVTNVHVDTLAKHGSATNAFADSTEWTQGTDFWAEWEEDHVCAGGMLFANGAWDYEPGTVKVVYTAGYSPNELSGSPTSPDSNGKVGGYYESTSLNASGITTAVLLTLAHKFHTWQQLKKQANVGFVPGSISGERLGDYSYTLSPSAQLTSVLTNDLPKEAKEALEPFMHYGLARL